MMVTPKTFQGRKIKCAKTGKLHCWYPEVRTFEFADYSWECKGCGGRHCSQCTYESDGETIIVHDCGRFDGKDLRMCLGSLS